MSLPRSSSLREGKVVVFAATLVVGVFLLASVPVFAATGINHTINFQGKLVNSDGTNVANGSGYELVFKLYNTSSGGTSVWSETQTGVTVTDGIFRVSLGSVASLTGVDFNNDTLYLGIQVTKDASGNATTDLEMTPRIQMTSVPYAFNAEKVNGLAVTNESGNPFSSATTLKLKDGSTVSFGGAFSTTAGDDLSLTLTGNTTLSLGGSGAITLVDTSTSQTLTNKLIGSTGLVFSGAATDISTTTNEVLTLTPNGTGNVVINPNAGGQAALIIDKQGDNDLFTASASGQTKFTVAHDGSVTLASGATFSIGTSSGYTGDNASCVNITGGIVTGTGSSCSSGSGTSYWNLVSGNGVTNGGYISPINATADLLLGGTATSSAKFGVLNLNTGIPIASVSSGTNGTGLYLTADGTLATTGMQSLVLGNSSTYNTTGNILLNPNGVGSVGIGTTLPLSATGLHVRKNAAGNAAMIVEQLSNAGDIFTASNSAGVSALTITKGGNIVSNINARWMPTSDATNALYIANSFGSPFVQFDSSNFQVGIGSGLTPRAALDILGSASESANLTFRGVGTGHLINILDGGTLDFRGSVGGDAGVSTSTSRLFIDSVGRVGIGVTSPIAGKLQLSNSSVSAVGKALAIFDQSENQDIFTASSSGTTRFSIANNGGVTISPNNTTDTALTINTMLAAKSTGISIAGLSTAANATGINIGQINGTGNGTGIQIGSISSAGINNYGLLVGSISGGTNNYAAVFAGGLLGIGTITPSTYLQLTDSAQPASGKSLAIFDQYENQDIFTASVSGVTKFVINNNGNVGIGTSTPTAAKLVVSESNAPTIDMAQVVNSTGISTSGVDGLQIDYKTAGTTSSADNAGLRINVTAGGSGTSSTLTGINIANLAGTPSSNVTESALQIGTGWDKGLVFTGAEGTYTVHLASDAGTVASGITFGTTSPISIYKSASGQLTIGDGTNGLVLDAATGPAYQNGMRPTRTITLSPEFAGAVLTASGSASSSTNGSMTSDASTSASLTWRNYYQWTSSQTSLQNYTIAVEVTLPKDFSDWVTTNAIQINFNTALTTTDTNKLDVTIYNSTDSTATPVVYRQAQVSGTAKTWTTVNIDRSDLIDTPTWNTAGQRAVIYLKMSAKDNNYVQVGDIQLNYLSKF